MRLNPCLRWSGVALRVSIGLAFCLTGWWTARAAVMTEDEPGFTLRDGPQLLVDTPWLFTDLPKLSITNTANITILDAAVEMMRATNSVAAMDALRQAGAAETNSADLIVARAWLFARQKRFDDALGEARQAKMAMPFDPTPDLLAGYCFHAMGRTNDALRAYQDALKYSSAKLPLIHQNIGLLLLMQGDVTNALPHFAMATALRPRAVASDLTGAYSTNEPVPLDATRSEAIEAARRSAEYQATVGVAFLKANRPADAVGYLREAVRIRPTYVQALNMLATALEQTDDLTGSLDTLAQSIETMPSQTAAWLTLRAVLQRLYTGQNGENAAPMLQILRALADAPDEPRVYRAGAPYLERDGRPRLAAIFLARAVRLESAPARRAAATAP